MAFFAEAAYLLVLLFGALLTGLKGWAAALFTSAMVLGLMLAKGLPLAGIIGTVALALLRVLLEKRVASPALAIGTKDSFLLVILRSVLILLILGAFFGPVTSILAWLAISGLEVLPSFKSSKRAPALWKSLLLRAGTAFGLLCLGIYAVCAG